MEQSHAAPTAPHANLVNVSGIDLVFRPVPVTDRTPTARQVLAAMGLAPHSEYVVLQWLPGGDIEEVRPEELVDVTGATTPQLIIVRSDRTYRFVLNDRAMEWPAAAISEQALRTLGAVNPAMQIFLAREDEEDSALVPGDEVNLRAEGVEIFYAKSKEWKLNVQGVVVESHTPQISVREAIDRAGFDIGTKWIIILKTVTQKKQVDLDYVIDLREPGIEKLRLTPREINNGEVTALQRRDFALLPTDQAWLDARNPDWSTMIDGGRRWLVLRGMTLPAGYNVTVVTIAMEIPTAYPMAEIDMFYCHPHLSRTDGRPIPQTQIVENVGGRPFQRWSRHRGAVAPWVPGKDSVVTHLLLIDESLSREVDK